jgi:hypothetical protein
MFTAGVTQKHRRFNPQGGSGRDSIRLRSAHVHA